MIKMKCTVVGYKRLSGKSKKTGNDYDFYSVSITYKGERGYVGEQVKEINVEPVMVQNIDKLNCPFKADIDVGLGGRISSINFT